MDIQKYIDSHFFKGGKYLRNSTQGVKHQDFFRELSLITGIAAESRSENLFRFLHPEAPNKCEECLAQTEFKDFHRGYREFCSLSCTRKCKRLKAEKKASMETTLMREHGVTNAMHLSKVKQKMQETIKSRYGVNWYVESSSFKQKFKSTSIGKYGVHNPSCSDEVKLKFKDTVFAKYGRISARDFSKNREFQFYRIKKQAEDLNIQILTDVLDDQLNLTDQLIKYAHTGCGHEWQQMANYLPACPVCHRGSKVESEVKEWVKSLNIPFKFNDRTIIKPFELDVLLIDKNIAIEVNGLYWHHDGSGKMTVYEKTKLCRDKGVQLISIWENEWGNMVHS